MRRTLILAAFVALGVGPIGTAPLTVGEDAPQECREMTPPLVRGLRTQHTIPVRAPPPRR